MVLSLHGYAIGTALTISKPTTGSGTFIVHSLQRRHGRQEGPESLTERVQ